MQRLLGEGSVGLNVTKVPSLCLGMLETDNCCSVAGECIVYRECREDLLGVVATSIFLKSLLNDLRSSVAPELVLQ